jgi:ketosteroid isomerase-like protein
MVCEARGRSHDCRVPFPAMNMRATAVLASAFALLSGCSDSSPGLAKADIIAADKAFSAMSVKAGPKTAFLEYFGSNAKVLGVIGQGKDGIAEVFMQYPSTASLSWEPSYADISSSGDLGYTWGRYTLIVPSTAKGKEPLVQMGTYVTIWKHMAIGGWKVVLDGDHPDGQK